MYIFYKTYYHYNSGLNFIKSYLTVKTQFVNINVTLSAVEHISCGVPQDTTLSPLLFNVQIDDINSLALNGKLVCFADDTTLIISGGAWNDVL